MIDPGPTRLESHPALAVIQRVSVSGSFRTRLRRTLEEGEAAVNALIRSYDPSLADHHSEVVQVATGIAYRLGLTHDTVRGIGLAASIHDVGTIGMPGTFGCRADIGAADPAATHARCGASMVDGIRFPWPIIEMLLQHHERVDGSGQPDGLGGGSILLGARVISVAEAVASRSTATPSLDVALAQLASGRATQYDPGVVDACFSLFPRTTGPGHSLPIRGS